MLKFPIYLDNNATTPCDPAVVQAMLPWFTANFGNAASRTHAYGWQAAEAVQMAREQLARLINCEPDEVIFTSGATESVNLALKGVYEAYSRKGNHIITVATEHKAVLDTCAHLEKIGASITFIPVDLNGLIDPDDLRSAITPSTILIAVMYANNETGVVQPIREAAAIAKKNNVLFFSDATQAVGKIAIDVMQDQIDIMAFNAHKMYGPKGVGALYVRRKNPRVRLSPLIDGGGHEKGLRSGTLNVPGIVGFGKAAEMSAEIFETGYSGEVQHLRDKLEAALAETIGGLAINGKKASRLPHVSNISFPQSLISSINQEIAVSSGSACTSALIEPSYVLKAMGSSDEAAFNSIRFSLGRYTTGEEIDFVTDKIKKVHYDICKRESQREGTGIDAGTESLR